MALIHTPKIKKESYNDPLSKRQYIEDCKVLLTSLPEGIYAMDWGGNLPKFGSHKDDNPENRILEISVKNEFEFNKIFQLKVPLRMKKIQICKNNLDCLESWTKEQLNQMCSRLNDILNGTYYH
jgi:hypothetical protein